MVGVVGVRDPWPSDVIDDPRQLHAIGRDVRIDDDEEGVAVSERLGRIAVEPPGRAVGRQQSGHCGQRVLQAGRAIGIALWHRGHIVVADGKEVRDASGPRDPLHDRCEHGPPLAALSAEGGVPGREDESDRIRRLGGNGDHRHHAIHDLRVLGLHLAWRIGGGIGNAMARWMARVARCPADPQSIGSQMGYPYAVRWLGVAGGFRHLMNFDSHGPMLYIYGERKPFMFHSRAWIERLSGRRGCRVLSLPTGHWVMIVQRREFNDALLLWLGETEKQIL